MRRHAPALALRIRAALVLLQAERRGVTALEYGIIAAFLCLSLLGIFGTFSGVLVAMFSRASASL